MKKLIFAIILFFSGASLFPLGRAFQWGSRRLAPGRGFSTTSRPFSKPPYRGSYAEQKRIYWEKQIRPRIERSLVPIPKTPLPMPIPKTPLPMRIQQPIPAPVSPARPLMRPLDFQKISTWGTSLRQQRLPFKQEQPTSSPVPVVRPRLSSYLATSPKTVPSQLQPWRQRQWSRWWPKLGTAELAGIGVGGLTGLLATKILSSYQESGDSTTKSAPETETLAEISQQPLLQEEIVAQQPLLQEDDVALLNYARMRKSFKEIADKIPELVSQELTQQFKETIKKLNALDKATSTDEFKAVSLEALSFLKTLTPRRKIDVLEKINVEHSKLEDVINMAKIDLEEREVKEEEGYIQSWTGWLLGGKQKLEKEIGTLGETLSDYQKSAIDNMYSLYNSVQDGITRLTQSKEDLSDYEGLQKNLENDINRMSSLAENTEAFEQNALETLKNRLEDLKNLVATEGHKAAIYVVDALSDIDTSLKENPLIKEHQIKQAVKALGGSTIVGNIVIPTIDEIAKDIYDTGDITEEKKEDLLGYLDGRKRQLDAEVENKINTIEKKLNNLDEQLDNAIKTLSSSTIAPEDISTIFSSINQASTILTDTSDDLVVESLQNTREEITSLKFDEEAGILEREAEEFE